MEKSLPTNPVGRVSQIANLFQRKTDEIIQPVEQITVAVAAAAAAASAAATATASVPSTVTNAPNLNNKTPVVIVRTKSHSTRFNNARALFEKLGVESNSNPKMSHSNSREDSALYIADQQNEQFSSLHSHSSSDHSASPPKQRAPFLTENNKLWNNNINNVNETKMTASTRTKLNVDLENKFPNGMMPASRLKTDEPLAVINNNANFIEKPEKPERKFYGRESNEKQKRWPSTASATKPGRAHSDQNRCDIIRTGPGTTLISGLSLHMKEVNSHSGKPQLGCGMAQIQAHSPLLRHGLLNKEIKPTTSRIRAGSSQKSAPLSPTKTEELSRAQPPPITQDPFEIERRGSPTGNNVNEINDVKIVIADKKQDIECSEKLGKQEKCLEVESVCENIQSLEISTLQRKTDKIIMGASTYGEQKSNEALKEVELNQQEEQQDERPTLNYADLGYRLNPDGSEETEVYGESQFYDKIFTNGFSQETTTVYATIKTDVEPQQFEKEKEKDGETTNARDGADKGTTKMQENTAEELDSDEMSNDDDDVNDMKRRTILHIDDDDTPWAESENKDKNNEIQLNASKSPTEEKLATDIPDSMSVDELELLLGTR